jgi:hypothetical protein
VLTTIQIRDLLIPVDPWAAPPQKSQLRGRRKSIDF